MKLKSISHIVISQLLTLVLCVYSEHRAHVGLVETAPEYGTYPHKTSRDLYMDPCKARKSLFILNWQVFCLYFCVLFCFQENIKGEISYLKMFLQNV